LGSKVPCFFRGPFFPLWLPTSHGDLSHPPDLFFFLTRGPPAPHSSAFNASHPSSLAPNSPSFFPPNGDPPVLDTTLSNPFPPPPPFYCFPRDFSRCTDDLHEVFHFFFLCPPERTPSRLALLIFPPSRLGSSLSFCIFFEISFFPWGYCFNDFLSEV